MTEILLKVALNTITLVQPLTIGFEHRHMIHSVLTVFYKANIMYCQHHYIFIVIIYYDHVAKKLQEHIVADCLHVCLLIVLNVIRPIKS